MALKILRVSLKNFGQFKSKEIKFNGNTAAIIGPNGAGKSTLLAAIYFGLTGEVLKDSKADWLTDVGRGGKAEKGHVELEFTYDGQHGIIRRMLHTSACLLKYGDTKLTKANEVNEFMTKLMGVTKRTFSKYCCVAQGQTEAIVSDVGSVRSDAFAELFGSQHCKRIYDVLGKEEALLVKTDYTNLVEEAAKRLNTIHGNINKTSAELHSIETQLHFLGDRKKHEHVVRQYLEGRGLQESIDQILEQLEQIAEELNAGATVIADKTELVNELEAARDSIKTRYEQAKKMLTSLELNVMYSAARQSLLSHEQALKRAIAEANAKLKNLTEPLRQVSEDQLANLKHDLDHHFKIIEHYKQFKDTGDKLLCPTCGHEIEGDADASIKFVTETQPIYQALLAAKKEEDQRILEYHSSQKALQELIKSKEYELNDLGIQLADNQLHLQACSIPPGINKQTEEDFIKDYEALCRELQTNKEVLEFKTQENLKLNKRLTELTERFSKLNAKLGEVPNEKAYNEATDALTRLEEITRKKDTLRGLLQGYEQEYVSAQANYEKLVKLQAEAQKIQRYAELIATTRSIMHRDNLPRIRAQQYIETINERLQSYLTKFDSKFQAQLQPDYEFECVFPDGKKQPAGRLSGGEKVRLSLAFRFAVNELFAKNLGLLILDEPTVFLDDENVMYLAEIFDQLKLTAQNADMQVIVVTHQKELQGHFDTTVVL